MGKYREIGKYISILQRLNHIYYENQLSPYQIGCGQQFFLLRICEKPGMKIQDLASFGHFDKATAARAVKKLEEEGYVRTEKGKEDKRVRRIYATDKAKPVVEKTMECVDEWSEIILEGFDSEERQDAMQLLVKMAANAYQYNVKLKRKD